ncbi:MAG TPA: hypothetical protein VEB59_00625 [Gemmatimonadales bacterium]|nr:hypothetical protein [Gemmatimonadales bacterium]
MKKLTRTLVGAAVMAGSACGGGGSDRGTETAAIDTATADTAPAPPPNELAIAGVMIGKRIGENNLITEPTFQFGPRDTVYVSVGTTGAPDSANLTAVWKFQGGKTVDSTVRTIEPEGATNTEFHVTNPKGWPVGTYLVTIYADGDSVAARTFAVKKQ